MIKPRSSDIRHAPSPQTLRLLSRRAAIGAMCCGLLAVLAIPFADLPLAQIARADQLPGDLRALFRLSEAFSHGYGAVLILTGVIFIGRVPWRGALTLVGLTFFPGLAVNLLKLTVTRQRPGTYADALPDSAWSSFHGFLGWLHDPDLFGRMWQSFPSGHTATAVGLAIALSVYFGRGRCYFGLLAGLAAWQRIDSGAHFPSDTLAGAAVALACGGAQVQWLVRHPRWCQFDRALTPIVSDTARGESSRDSEFSSRHGIEAA